MDLILNISKQPLYNFGIDTDNHDGFLLNPITNTFSWFSFEKISDIISQTGATIDNSAYSAITATDLECLITSTNNNLFCEYETSINQMSFTYDEKKKQLLKKLKKEIVDLNISSTTYVGEEYDIRPVLVAEKTGTPLITAAYDESTNCYSRGFKFIFILYKNNDLQKKLEEIGKENFQKYFLNKINKK